MSDKQCTGIERHTEVLDVSSQHHFVENLAATHADKSVTVSDMFACFLATHESSISGACLLTKGEGAFRKSWLNAGLGTSRRCLLLVSHPVSGSKVSLLRSWGGRGGRRPF